MFEEYAVSYQEVLKKLEYLCFVFTSWILADSFLKVFIENCENLKVFRLSGARGADAMSLIDLFKANLKIETLFLNCEYLQNDEILTRLVENPLLKLHTFNFVVGNFFTCDRNNFFRDSQIFSSFMLIYQKQLRHFEFTDQFIYTTDSDLKYLQIFYKTNPEHDSLDMNNENYLNVVQFMSHFQGIQSFHIVSSTGGSLVDIVIENNVKDVAKNLWSETLND